MVVNNIVFDGINNLYTFIVNASTVHIGTNRTFENNLYQVLSNYSLIYELDEVSEYDYIILKRLFTNVSRFERTALSEDFISFNYRDISESYNKLKKVLSKIQNEIKEKNNIDIDFSRIFVPSGLNTGKCVVRITGNSLVAFTNNNPANFFKILSNNKCISYDGSLIQSYSFNIENDEHRNNLVKIFLNYFYSKLTELVFTNDVISDGTNRQIYNDRLYYASVIKSIVFDSKICCDYTSISTVTTYCSPSDIITTFTLNTPFGIYFDLMNTFPNRCFINTENITIPNKLSDDIPIISKNLTSYNDELLYAMKAMLRSIDDNYNNTVNIIKKYELTQNYSQYKYTIELTLSDINQYLSDIKIDKNDPFSSDKSKIFKFIIEKGSLLYNNYIK